MKVGDLVKCHYLDKIGVVLRKYSYDDPTWTRIALHDHSPPPAIYKFDVMWRDGTIGPNIPKFDLEVLSEAR